MHKMTVFGCIVLLPVLNVYAQKVGIGTPSPAGALQVNHKSLLVSPTLMLFDSTGGIGPWQQFGAAGTANYFTLGGQLSNTLATNQLRITYNNALTGFSFTANNRLGINTFVPARTLDVNGDVNIAGRLFLNGDVGTAEQVLVSKGAALPPEWQTPTPPVAFTARMGSLVTLGNNVNGVLIWTDEDFDKGNNINNQFSVPVAGIYHVDLSVKWGTNTSAANYVQTDILKCDNNLANCTTVARSKMNNQVAPQQSLSINLELQAGQTLKIGVLQTNLDTDSRTIEFNSNATFFSAYLVR